MSNKDRAEYSKKISKKLLELGVKDETLPAGKTFAKRFTNDKGEVVFETKCQSLSNPHHNMVKRLRNLDKATIEAFLGVSIKEEKEEKEAD